MTFNEVDERTEDLIEYVVEVVNDIAPPVNDQFDMAADHLDEEAVDPFEDVRVPGRQAYAGSRHHRAPDSDLPSRFGDGRRINTSCV